MLNVTIEVNPLAGAIGAEIRGVDLSQHMHEATFEAIHRAFLEYQVLVFPDQERLTIEQHIAFAARFGSLAVDPMVKSADGHPELLVLIKNKDETRAFGESWHSDNTYMGCPPLGSFLLARELPPFGGDTQFSNQYAAYEALSPGLKQVLDGLEAVHTAETYNKSLASGRYTHEQGMRLRHDAIMEAALRQQSVHPVVRTHPETGRKALYVNAAYTKNFAGWTAEESEPLLKFLYGHAIRSEFTCRIRWTPNALVCWDNRCTMHQAINDYHGHRRVMHRVTAEGTRPV